MSFHTYDTVFCPECEPTYHPKGFRVGPALECIGDAGGDCIDLGECPRCGKVFEVSYQVKEVTAQ